MSEDRHRLPTLISAERLEQLGAEKLFESARIVKRRVLDRIDEIDSALSRAEADAADAVAAAERDADELRRKAEARGAADGMRQFMELVATREVARSDARRLAEEDMLDLAFMLARRLVGRELELESSAYVDLVAECLRQARQAPRVVLRIHPNAARKLEDHKKELHAHLDGVPLDIASDPELNEFDCVVETPDGTVDGRFEMRLQALRHALTGSDQ